MAKFKNISAGPRGLHAVDGLVMVDAGKSADVTLAENEDANPEWFEALGAAAAEVDAGEPGPLDGSVDELTEHLATVTDPDEVQALIDAETAGKSRKGALAALEARRDELLA